MNFLSVSKAFFPFFYFVDPDPYSEPYPDLKSCWIPTQYWSLWILINNTDLEGCLWYWYHYWYGTGIGWRSTRTVITLFLSVCEFLWYRYLPIERSCMFCKILNCFWKYRYLSSVAEHCFFVLAPVPAYRIRLSLL